MTQGDDGSTPLTPEEEALVARMLADAGGPVPMPADVAARLDDVLVELEDERGSPVDVVPLRAHRRWPRVLLAAATVVVGGYAVGTVATQGTLSGSEDAMSGAADSESAGEAPTDSMLLDEGSAADGSGSQEEQGGQGDPGTPKKRDRRATQDDPAASLSEQGYDAVRLPVRLRSDRLDAGVRRALGVLERSPRAELARKSGYEACPGPELSGKERSLPVRYDGEAAVLVAGPERNGTVEVTVHTCAGDELDSLLVRP